VRSGVAGSARETMTQTANTSNGLKIDGRISLLKLSPLQRWDSASSTCKRSDLRGLGHGFRCIAEDEADQKRHNEPAKKTPEVRDRGNGLYCHTRWPRIMN